MTKETFLDTQGGPKKFLYSGPVKRHGAAQFDDDVDDREWNFDGHINTTTNRLQHEQSKKSSEFDIDTVWSVKKNINAPSVNMKEAAPLSQGLNANVGKGYYSRHAGATGDTGSDYVPSGFQTSGIRSGQSVKPQGQTSSHGFSYSYGNTPSDTPREASQSTSDPAISTSSRPPGRQQYGNMYRTGGISQGGRVGASNPGKSKNRPF